MQLSKSKNCAEESGKTEYNNKIKKLEEELAVKEERYALLLAKMSNS